MRSRVLLAVVVILGLFCGSVVESRGCDLAAATVRSNVVTVAPTATFAVPTMIGSVVTASAAVAVPQAVVVPTTVTVPTVTIAPQAVVSPTIVQQRIRVQSTSRVGIRSLLCR